MYSYQSIGFLESRRSIFDFRKSAMCPFLVSFSCGIILTSHDMSTRIIHPHPKPNQILISPGTTKAIPDLQLDLDSIHQCTYLYINTTKLHDLNLRLVSQPPKYTRRVHIFFRPLSTLQLFISEQHGNHSIIPQQTIPL
jgi:hypothetical protein